MREGVYVCARVRVHMPRARVVGWMRASVRAHAHVALGWRVKREWFYLDREACRLATPTERNRPGLPFLLRRANRFACLRWSRYSWETRGSRSDPPRFSGKFLPAGEICRTCRSRYLSKLLRMIIICTESKINRPLEEDARLTFLHCLVSLCHSVH